MYRTSQHRKNITSQFLGVKKNQGAATYTINTGRLLYQPKYRYSDFKTLRENLVLVEMVVRVNSVKVEGLTVIL